jgi:ribosomal protein L11 methyltransferase
MKNYKQFTVSANPFNVDVLSGALWELEILGLNEYDNYLTVFVYDDSDVSKIELEKSLDKIKNENLIENYSLSEEIVENKNWNAEWESNLNIIEVSERIVIKPSFRDYESKENQIVITIDPKMSFGTGEHETTKLMLKLVDKYIADNASVLDVGSGTSVLGIAASKLGAKNVISIDNDEWCYINGVENVEKNNLKNVKVLNGTIDSLCDRQFNLVLANINLNVLLEIKKELFNKVDKSGLLILSGILLSDLEEIKRQFIPLGLTALEHLEINNWIGIVLKKY